MEQITVKKFVAYQPVSITGTDEQGRTTVICPQCHDDAWIEGDSIVCPTDQAMRSVLDDAYERLTGSSPGQNDRRVVPVHR